MSAAVAKLIFVVALVLNLLLWSNGRYGQTLGFKSMRVQEHGGLVRRISYELMHPGEVSTSEDTCSPTSEPPQLQCKYVEEQCPSLSTFLSIDYLHSYFCTRSKLRPLVFIGLTTWLIFLFSFLGISASDFFTPNLASIAQMLGLDENVAGVTFLAFGNGSPDLFSTFSAMRAGSGSLAVGELLGAATFIVSCVVGSMCIIKPFHVHRAPFLRDVGFFTLAVGMVLLILYDGQVGVLESGLLVVIYVTYVIIVVVGTWWENRKQRIRQREALIRNEYGEDTTSTFPPYRDEPSQLSSAENGHHSTPVPIPGRVRAVSTPEPPRLHITLPPRPKSRTPSPGPRTTQLPSFSLVSALEFRDVVSSLQVQAARSSLNIFESHVTPYAGGLYRHRSRGGLSPSASMASTPGDEGNRYADGRLRLDDRRSAPSISTIVPEEDENGELADERGESTAFSIIPSIYRTSAQSQEQLFTPPTKRERMWTTGKAILFTLFPTLHRLREQSVLGKIVSVIAAPAVMALTLTLPVVVMKYECPHRSAEKLSIGGGAPLVEIEEDGMERLLIAEEEVEENLHHLRFNKWLMATQCILGPLFCTAVLFAGYSYGMWIMLASVIAGFAVAVLVLIFAQDGCHPYAKMARCSMGFLVSMVWIMAIADEVVQVLQTFGSIFGLSDAIIGLTIFAVGNSLADLVANMSVAVFAPIMGFSACFGGPMLNILLGIGISGSWIAYTTKHPYTINLSPTLIVSSVGLLVLLAATLIFVPLNNYHLTRRWGMLLILAYLVIMGINLFVEIRHLK